MNRSVSHGIKGLACGALLALSALALALPTPKDIEASVQAGQFQQAEMQLREVLKEKPLSAKAHYELGQVLAREGKFSDAATALREAKRLDPTLKFAASAQRFDTLLNKVSATQSAPHSGPTFTSPDLNPQPASAAPTPKAPAQAVPTPAPHEPSLPWTPILLGVGGLAALLLWRRRPSATNGRTPGTSANSPLAQAPASAHGFGASPARGGYQEYPSHPAAAAPRSGLGSTVGSAVVGGVAGLAAGYALSKVLGNDHPTVAGGPLPTPTPSDDFNFSSPSGSQPDFGAFDAGNGDSWDGADAGSGSDDW